MRQLFIVLLSAFACISFTDSYGEDLNFSPAQILCEQPYVEMTAQKIYIQPSEIYFSDNQIFVQTSTGLMPVNLLGTDSKGVHYIVHPNSWVCQHIDETTGQRCGHYNTYTYYCEHCGHAPAKRRE